MKFPHGRVVLPNNGSILFEGFLASIPGKPSGLMESAPVSYDNDGECNS